MTVEVLDLHGDSSTSIIKMLSNAVTVSERARGDSSRTGSLLDCFKEVIGSLNIRCRRLHWLHEESGTNDDQVWPSVLPQNFQGTAPPGLVWAEGDDRVSVVRSLFRG